MMHSCLQKTIGGYPPNHNFTLFLINPSHRNYDRFPPYARNCFFHMKMVQKHLIFVSSCQQLSFRRFTPWLIPSRNKRNYKGKERFPLRALRQKVEDLAYLSRYFRRIFKADYENLSVSNQLWLRVNLTCLIPAVLKQKAIYLFLSFWNELHVELADYSVQRQWWILLVY
jgi:hypothetical protein